MAVYATKHFALCTARYSSCSMRFCPVSSLSNRLSRFIPVCARLHGALDSTCVRTDVGHTARLAHHRRLHATQRATRTTPASPDTNGISSFSWHWALASTHSTVPCLLNTCLTLRSRTLGQRKGIFEAIALALYLAGYEHPALYRLTPLLCCLL